MRLPKPRGSTSRRSLRVLIDAAGSAAGAASSARTAAGPALDAWTQQVSRSLSKLAQQKAVLVFVVIEFLVAIATCCFFIRHYKVSHLGLPWLPSMTYAFVAIARAVCACFGLYGVVSRSPMLLRNYYCMFVVNALLGILSLVPILRLECECTSFKQCEALQAFATSDSPVLMPFLQPQGMLQDRKVPYQDPPSVPSETAMPPTAKRGVSALLERLPVGAKARRRARSRQGPREVVAVGARGRLLARRKLGRRGPEPEKGGGALEASGAEDAEAGASSPPAAQPPASDGALAAAEPQTLLERLVSAHLERHQLAARPPIRFFNVTSPGLSWASARPPRCRGRKVQDPRLDVQGSLEQEVAVDRELGSQLWHCAVNPRCGVVSAEVFDDGEDQRASFCELEEQVTPVVEGSSAAVDLMEALTGGLPDDETFDLLEVDNATTVGRRANATPTRQGGDASEQAASASRLTVNASGRAADASRHAATAPGRSANTSRQAANASEQAAIASGRAANTSRQAANASKKAATVPAWAANTSRQAVTASGQAANASGQAANASKQAADASKQAAHASRQAANASGRAANASEQAGNSTVAGGAANATTPANASDQQLDSVRVGGGRHPNETLVASIYFQRNGDAISKEMFSDSSEAGFLYKDVFAASSAFQGMELLSSILEDECRCSGKFPSCRTYRDKVHQKDRYWCSVSKAMQSVCQRRGVKLLWDAKEGMWWTEELCGGGCVCSGIGMVPPGGAHEEGLDAALLWDNGINYGSACRRWKHSDPWPWCYVGWDSSCADRERDKEVLEVQSTDGSQHLAVPEQYRSNLPCSEMLQDANVREATTRCMATSQMMEATLSLMFLLCLPAAVVMFKFLSNRCGDDGKLEQQLDTPVEGHATEEVEAEEEDAADAAARRGSGSSRPTLGGAFAIAAAADLGNSTSSSAGPVFRRPSLQARADAAPM